MEAPGLGALHDQYAPQGFTALTLMIEGGDTHFSGIPPDQEWLQGWIDRHDLNHPVLADPDWTINQQFWGDSDYPVPRTMILRPGMEIAYIGGVGQPTLPDPSIIEMYLP